MAMSVPARDSSDHSDATAFLAAEVKYVEVGAASMAYRAFGSGPPLLFVHGWPLSGFTYRKVIPPLATSYTCYAVDLPGAGQTRWRGDNDFSFRGQAANLKRFAEALDLRAVHLVAHDTGATIARALALIAGERIGKMVLINTEIPGHRPPWIPLFQRLAGLPGAITNFKLLLSFDFFVRSSMGFGNCFVDKNLIGGEFSAEFIRPMVKNRTRMEGQIRYLRGIDWQLVDSLAQEHRRISNPVLFVWGADDPTFPAARAREMVTQLADCRGFHAIPDAKLLVHEEKPEAVADYIAGFLRS